MSVVVRLVSVALVACVITVATGCAEETDLGTPAVTVGSGDTTFEALDDGDSIFVIQGPQGGFHVLGSARVTGIEPGDPDNLQDPSNPTTTFTVLMGTERVDADASSYTQGLKPVGGSGDYEMIGRLVILDILDDSELDGAMIRLVVEVVGTDGNTASDSRLLMATPHPANQ